MSDTGRSESEHVAFCQNCGRPLRAGDARTVGNAVYCEPCLAQKIAAAESSAAAGSSAGAGSYGFSGTSSGVNYKFQGGMPPPSPPSSVPGAPNPGLAALLGFIPGVGAFYNGQYAKGVVHLVVFALLTSLSHGNGVFGLFVAGWMFYQVIEAYHTARARRDGTPLPNPFGLNDIGERLGFGRAWPAPSPVGGQAPPPAANGAADPAAGAPVGGGYVPPAAAYAAPPPYAPPQQDYAQQYPPQQYPPQGDPRGYTPPVSGASWGGPAESFGGVPPTGVGTNAPFSPVRGWGSRFPTGAISLIVLGVIFLIGNSGLFRGFPVHLLIPFLLIGVGVWLFVRKMMETGDGLSDDGTPAYRVRLFRAARGPVWIVLVGVLFLLDSFRILSWGRSWPLFIIVGGVMTFFERTVYTSAIPPQYGYPGAVPPVAPEPGGPAASSTVTPSSVVPGSSAAMVDDREGR